MASSRWLPPNGYRHERDALSTTPRCRFLHPAGESSTARGVSPSPLVSRTAHYVMAMRKRQMPIYLRPVAVAGVAGLLVVVGAVLAPAIGGEYFTVVVGQAAAFAVAVMATT